MGKRPSKLRWKKENGEGMACKSQGELPGHSMDCHYAILGPYDYMDIYEAPDVETAHKVSLISRAEGALEADIWQALQYEKFLALLNKIEE